MENFSFGAQPRKTLAPEAPRRKKKRWLKRWYKTLSKKLCKSLYSNMHENSVVSENPSISYAGKIVKASEFSVGKKLEDFSVSTSRFRNILGSSFSPAFVQELFDRNVRWIVSKYPGLLNVEGDNLRSCIRMTQSFLATKTGKRLAAFQSFFMNEVNNLFRDLYICS